MEEDIVVFTRTVLSRILKVCGILSLGAVPLLANISQTIAYTGVSGAGFQNWTGSLGMEFTVNSAISVDYVGVFNSNGSGPLTAPLEVGIYNVATQQLVPGTEYTFPIGTSSTQLPGDATDLFKAIAPVTLTPGPADNKTIYEVVAGGFGGGNQLNGNQGFFPSSVGATETGGAFINYVGTAYYGNAGSGLPLTFPTNTDTNPANRYDAGTFAFTATPEPGFYGVLALGLSGLVVAVRRRKSA